MPFYAFHQNNSGGRFVHDRERGIGREVIVEARDRLEAIVFAEDIGLYWDGVEGGRDCGCCGDRWYASSLMEGTETPEVSGDEEAVLGAPIPDQFADIGSQWGYVHYRDGRIVPFYDPQYLDRLWKSLPAVKEMV